MIDFENKFGHLPIEERVRAGLNDINPSIRLEAANLLEHLHPCPLDLVEAALTDPVHAVRHMACHVDAVLTRQQIDRGLRDESPEVRRQFAIMDGYKPTTAQAIAGLEDEDQEVRVRFLIRGDIDLPEAHVDRIFEEGRAEEVEACLENQTLHFTEKRLNAAMKLQSGYVRALAAARLILIPNTNVNNDRLVNLMEYRFLPFNYSHF